MANETYTFEEVKEEALKYFNGDELASTVTTTKYLLKNKNGDYIEKSPTDMFKRITSEFVRVENKYKNPLSYDTILNSLDRFKYVVPQGSPLYGIGNNSKLVSIGNCFVINSPKDSYGSILRADQQIVQIGKRRGGVGLDISNIRPKGFQVDNAAQTTDGIIAFMQRYSNTTHEVAQAGGRRGALMISILCSHMQILDFIKIKRDKTKVTGANISIKFTKEFFDCLENKKKFTLRHPAGATIEEASETKEIDPQIIWDEFIESNWQSAEPGALFWDNIINDSISDCYADDGFKSVSTNPCSELVLSEGASCILMLLNLNSFVENQFTDNASFNYKEFDKQINIATRLMDDMIDLEIEKVEQIIKKVKADKESSQEKQIEIDLWTMVLDRLIVGRRVGLGITALADALASLNLKYGSESSLKFIDEMFSFFHDRNFYHNATLSGERGYFKCWNWEKEKNNQHIKLLKEETVELIKKNGRRNISLQTIAPAGSISICTQTSSGIEPVFKAVYSRRKKISPDEEKKGLKPDYVDSDGNKWTTFEVYHHGLKTFIEKTGKTFEESPYFGCESHNLDWKCRVLLQSIIQKYITHSISSTCNIPKEITKEEVSKIYLAAYKSGCKGITTYRDGCREGVLVGKKEKETVKISENHAPKRPNVLPCEIYHSQVLSKITGKAEKWIFFIGTLDGRPYEVFGGKKENIDIAKKINNGWIVKNGKNAHGNSTYDLYLGTLEESEDRVIIKDIASQFKPEEGTITRMTSLSLRHGVPVHIVVQQLGKDIDSPMIAIEKCISRLLKHHIKDGVQASASETCPLCKSKLVYKDGCVSCSREIDINCPWSRC